MHESNRMEDNVHALPESLQSFRLRLKDLVRDMLIGCLSEGPRREARPEGCDVDKVGPEPEICG